MAEKEPIIVIKKITNVQAGGHGGSWKVAFADFMTAMMAFFLVMWLISQSEEVKKNVADYFSTPSIIEYNFANYGVELTLEKLFLDLMNEPLKFFEQFIKPTDYTPNVMTMGTKKIVIYHMADKLGDVATDVQVTDTDIQFEIPAETLFVPGTANPSTKFIEIMEHVNGVTAGLEESNIYIDSKIFKESVSENNSTKAKNVAEQRLDLISKKIEARLEHPTVDIYGKPLVEENGKIVAGVRAQGSIKVIIKQKENLLDKKDKKKFKELFGSKNESMNVYDNFVNQLSKRKQESKPK
ncbi:MAG: chemotaxis protein MotB [Bdellovibrionaceae bacterium]|nr:chemotaxis protein MotB [Pseudobdellovibrionaceae bacterium]